MKQSHLILSNALIMWMMRLFLFIPQIILVPFLIKTIGEEGYGVYALIWPLLISIDSLEISLQQGAVKYTAGYLAQNQIQKVNEVVSSSFAFSILLAVLASLSSFVAAAFYKDPTGRAGGALAVAGGDEIIPLVNRLLTRFDRVVAVRRRESSENNRPRRGENDRGSHCQKTPDGEAR